MHEFNAQKPTRVLFVGGGQDSVALLMLLHHNESFRKTYLGDANFCAIMADTGNEYPQTIDYVGWLSTWCAEHEIDFTFVGPHMGFHSQAWQSLTHQMERNNTIFSVSFPKTCTDNLKIKVGYKFLADWLRKKYGFVGSDSAVYYQYTYQFGKLVSWIGFAAGEEKRLATKPTVCCQPQLFDLPETGPDYIPKWRKRCIQHRYPLIELGMDRQACQQLIAGYGMPVPMPSNCMFCPFQNQAEIVYLFRSQPLQWQYWVQLEAAKQENNIHVKNNMGVKGRLTLPQYLQKALEKYGDWTIEQLRKYRYSHGHSVQSKY